jgi:ribosome-binding factor A
MQLIDQLKKYFYEMFDVAGFDEKTKEEMTTKMLDIWLTKSFVKIYDLMTDEEKKKLTELLNNYKKDIKNEQVKKVLSEFMTSFDEARKEKIADIFYDEAGVITVRMIEKFNLKSTPEQKKEYIKRVTPLLGDISK